MRLDQLPHEHWEKIVKWIPELALIFNAPDEIEIRAAVKIKHYVLKNKARGILKDAFIKDKLALYPVVLSAINNGYLNPEDVVNLGGFFTSAALIILAKKLISAERKKAKEILESIRKIPVDIEIIRNYYRKYGSLGFIIGLKIIGVKLPCEEILENIGEPKNIKIPLTNKPTLDILASIICGKISISNGELRIYAKDLKRNYEKSAPAGFLELLKDNINNFIDIINAKVIDEEYFKKLDPKFRAFLRDITLKDKNLYVLKYTNVNEIWYPIRDIVSGLIALAFKESLLDRNKKPTFTDIRNAIKEFMHGNFFKLLTEGNNYDFSDLDVSKNYVRNLVEAKDLIKTITWFSSWFEEYKKSIIKKWKENTLNKMRQYINKIHKIQLQIKIKIPPEEYLDGIKSIIKEKIKNLVTNNRISSIINAFNDAYSSGNLKKMLKLRGRAATGDVPYHLIPGMDKKIEDYVIRYIEKNKIILSICTYTRKNHEKNWELKNVEIHEIPTELLHIKIKARSEYIEEAEIKIKRDKMELINKLRQAFEERISEIERRFPTMLECLFRKLTVDWYGKEERSPKCTAIDTSENKKNQMWSEVDTITAIIDLLWYFEQTQKDKVYSNKAIIYRFIGVGSRYTSFIGKNKTEIIFNFSLPPVYLQNG